MKVLLLPIMLRDYCVRRRQKSFWMRWRDLYRLPHSLNGMNCQIDRKKGQHRKDFRPLSQQLNQHTKTEDDMNEQEQGLDKRLTLIMAIACAIAVGNLYYSQPIL